MKITYYCPPYWGDGGPASHAQGLVGGLRALGHEIQVLPSAAWAALPLGYRPPRRLLPQFAASALRNLRARSRAHAHGLAPNSVRAMGEFVPDRLIVRRSPYDLVADAVLEAASCPVIGEVNAVSFLEAETYFGRKYDRFERRRQLAFYERCGRLCCVTHEIKAQLEFLGLPGSKMVVVPNGVDTGMFHPAVPRAEGALDTLGSVEAVVGYCASVTPLHDLAVAVAAMRGAAGRATERVAFLFVGPQERDLAAAGADEAFLRRTVATGRVPHAEVPGLMACMDVACVALRGPHQSPLKVMEFMAMGVPVAAAADGSGLAALKEAGAGMVTPAGDAAALAASLKELIEQPDLRERLGAAGPVWVREHGTWEVAAARIIAQQET